MLPSAAVSYGRPAQNGSRGRTADPAPLAPPARVPHPAPPAPAETPSPAPGYNATGAGGPPGPAKVGMRGQAVPANPGEAVMRSVAPDTKGFRGRVAGALCGAALLGLYLGLAPARA